MCIVQQESRYESEMYGCAQAGCESCVTQLLKRHQGLVHACIQYAEIGGVVYAEAVQEGQIGLWLAILRYDPKRGVAFSTYAWRYIWGQIWDYTLAFCQKGEVLEEEALAQMALLTEEAWQEAQIHAALNETVGRLPERLREIVEEAYGLKGQACRSLAEIGRQMGLSRERIRQLRNEALVLLRMPALSIDLREQCDRDSREAYRQARQMNNVWLRRRRGLR